MNQVYKTWENIKLNFLFNFLLATVVEYKELLVQGFHLPDTKIDLTESCQLMRMLLCGSQGRDVTPFAARPLCLVSAFFCCKFSKLHLKFCISAFLHLSLHSSLHCCLGLEQKYLYINICHALFVFF